MSLPFLAGEVEQLRQAGLLRQPHRVRGTGPTALVDSREVLLFCSNNYLGLASATELAQAAASAAHEWGVGAGGSRLVSGDTDLHRELEVRLARFVGLPTALLLPSGYHANVGVLAALAGPGDLIVSDSLNHASIIDGIRLTRADVAITPHLDLAAVQAALEARPRRRAIVVTESLFSMDGDTPDLAGLRRVCDQLGAALVVDEAHALGVLGPSGRGLCAAAGVQPDILVGTLGKAFGCSGAFVAGDPLLRQLLVTKCRTHVFTTALPPPIVAAAIAALGLVEAADDRRARLAALTTRIASAVGAGPFRPALAGSSSWRQASSSHPQSTPAPSQAASHLQFATASPGRAPAASQLATRSHILSPPAPIVPIFVGDADLTMRLSRALLERGVFIQGIRPPTVPQGTSRLRLTVMATHTDEHIDTLLALLAELLP
jgi:8-amino-7-oxononanoate synthase